ncbi:MAG: hypothetical protein TREMPRED_005890 [Tremellales sp. Tagirdzhanova-0007]|nr:MAG: hypothetical protein TREMPRED_005890 [Tremellales sp. Tagirdzhanova-0007]
MARGQAETQMCEQSSRKINTEEIQMDATSIHRSGQSEIEVSPTDDPLTPSSPCSPFHQDESRLPVHNTSPAPVLFPPSGSSSGRSTPSQRSPYSESPYGGGMTSNGSGYTRATHDVEGQNNERLEGLLGKVKILKDITTGIGTEVRDSNMTLSGMPVLEFDAFMAISPCTKGTHTTASAPKPAAAASSTTITEAPTHVVDENGVEVYGAAPKPPTSTAPIVAPTPSPVAAVVTEEDDPTLTVPDGARCKRLGCEIGWEGEGTSRGKGGKAKCRYHPQPAVFHEGSKGYLCCKRRVLEFAEFLKIEGCTTGNHLFLGSKKDESKEEIVSCRLDHYQTPMQVHVSAFAKGADKARSKVVFESQQLHLDLFLPANKRVVKSITLYGPIDPSTSTFRILSTKIDMVLQKFSASSWPLLELPPAGSELPPGYALTFGVSGRTGTVGGKDIVLAPEEMTRR